MSSEAVRPLRVGGEPGTNAFPERSARLRVLSIEHDDLDCAIAALVKAGACDDLLIARLKKRKLQIKDAIAGAMAAGPAPAREQNLIRRDAVFPETSSRPGAMPGAHRIERSGSGGQVAAFIVMLAIVVMLCWPTADDQAALESALLYSLLLSSN